MELAEEVNVCTNNVTLCCRGGKALPGIRRVTKGQWTTAAAHANLLQFSVTEITWSMPSAFVSLLGFAPVFPQKMDIQTLLDNLNEDLSCKICYEIYKEPKQLPCLHSFCVACLNRLAETRAVNGKIQCPLCERQIDVPESGTFENFPVSFYINSLLDVLAIKECGVTRVTCGNCDKKSEQSSYCFDCSKFWCGECLNGHKILRENKEHRVTALKDFQEQDYEDVLKRPAICKKKHHEKLLEYYCNTCEEAACQMCLNVGHGGHEINPLEAVTGDEKAKILAEVERAETQIEQFTEDIKIAEADWLQTKENVEAVKRDVNSFAEEMIRVIREEQRRLITEAENTKKAEQDRVATNKENIRNQAKKVELAMKQAEDLLRRGASAEIVRSRKQIQGNLQQLVAEKPEIQVQGYKKVVFKENPLPNKNLTNDGIGRVGTTDTDRVQSTAEGDGLAEATVGLEAQFVVTTKNSNGDVCYSPLDRVAVEITRRGGQEPVKNVQIEDKQNGSYQVRYLVADPGERYLRVTVNGEDVRRGPFPPIRVKPSELKRLMSFGSEGTGPGQFKCPSGVAVNTHGEIAVSDYSNHRVQVFSSEGRFLFSFGEEGSGVGQFKLPCGVTYDRDDNLLLVDSWNQRIQQFSRRGQFLRIFVAKGGLGRNLNFPQAISTSPDGNIIVADRGNKRVVVFTPEGRVLLTLHGDQLNPLHCVSHGNRYFVSDECRNCIKVFSDQGDFLYQFGRKGTGDGEFGWPWGLAVDNSGRLVVCDGRNHRIQLFELDGTFCCKFGRQPSFNYPVSVAVLSDGKLAVTQLNGRNVQLLMWRHWNRFQFPDILSINQSFAEFQPFFSKPIFSSWDEIRLWYFLLVFAPLKPTLGARSCSLSAANNSGCGRERLGARPTSPPARLGPVSTPASRGQNCWRGTSGTRGS